MARRSSLGVLALVALGVLAGCGGAAAPGGSGTSGGSGTAGSGGGFDPCSLLTGDEAGGALHIEALKPTGTRGDSSSCSYALSSGEEALVVSVVGAGAAGQFQSFVDNGSAEVAGVGDKALFERGTRRLVFLAGGRFVAVFPRYAAGTDAALDASTNIGQIIASRLTSGSVPSGLAATPPPITRAQVACDLMSAAEAAAVLGLGSLTADSNGASQFCYYSLASTGEVGITAYFRRTGGSDAWGGLVGSMTTDPVTGLGEKATFEPGTNTLYMLQGDSIINVAVMTAGLGPAAALEQASRLARIMLTHL